MKPLHRLTLTMAGHKLCADEVFAAMYHPTTLEDLKSKVHEARMYRIENTVRLSFFGMAKHYLYRDYQ